MYSFNISTSPPPKQKKKRFRSQINTANPFTQPAPRLWSADPVTELTFLKETVTSWLEHLEKRCPHWKPVRRARPPPRQLQPHHNPLMNFASDISLVFTLVRPQSRNNSKPYLQVSCTDRSAGGPGNARPPSPRWSRYLGKPSVFFPPLQISKQFLYYQRFSRIRVVEDFVSRDSEILIV